MVRTLMGADQNHDWARETASVLEWWHDAGVDVLVEDQPLPWLELAATMAAAPAMPAAQPAAPVAADTMPDTIAAFDAWRAGDTVPDAGWPGKAIVAAGPVEQPALMVLLDWPERGDSERLMEAIEGRLFERMLVAIGFARETALVAAVCVRRPPGGRVARDAEAALGAIARHHVALVRPRRLLLMGDAASRAILEMNASEARGHLRPVYHKDQTITHAVASWHPRNLLDRPALKAEAWKDLLMLDTARNGEMQS